MGPQYLLLLDNAMYLYCCAEKKAELEKEYTVEVKQTLNELTHHCGLDCLRNKAA